MVLRRCLGGSGEVVVVIGLSESAETEVVQERGNLLNMSANLSINQDPLPGNQ